MTINMRNKPWTIGDPGSAFDRAWLIGASTRRFRSVHRLKSNLFSRQYCIAAKGDRYWYDVAAGTFIRPGSTFTAEIHRQIAGIDPDDAKNGI